MAGLGALVNHGGEKVQPHLGISYAPPYGVHVTGYPDYYIILNWLEREKVLQFRTEVLNRMTDEEKRIFEDRMRVLEGMTFHKSNGEIQPKDPEYYGLDQWYYRKQWNESAMYYRKMRILEHMPKRETEHEHIPRSGPYFFRVCESTKEKVEKAKQAYGLYQLAVQLDYLAQYRKRHPISIQEWFGFATDVIYPYLYGVRNYDMLFKPEVTVKGPPSKLKTRVPFFVEDERDKI